LSIWADKRRRTTLLLAAAVVLSAALIGGSRISSGETGTRAAAVPGSSLAGIPKAGAALGNPNAPVTLVEYADPQCPYCAEWARRTLPVLVDDYVRTGKLRIVFRGLAFIGPDSERALRAAIAAGRQNRLWDVIEALYRRQGPENGGWVTRAALEETAGTQALTESGEPWITRRIMLAGRAARTAAITGTPAFQLGRSGGVLRLVPLHSLGPEGLRPAIEAALAA
jgi:protein-disulfide isomerase